jgi:hypothetical protein
VAVDSAGNLFVADTSDNRVLEFAQPFSSGQSAGQSAQKVFGQSGSFTTIASAAASTGSTFRPASRSIPTATSLSPTPKTAACSNTTIPSRAAAARPASRAQPATLPPT